MNISYELCKNSDIQTVKIEYEEDSKVIKKYLHSKYNPLTEAKDWAKSIYDKENRVYIVYGGGMLYHIMALSDLIDKEEDKIIVFEPIEELYEKNKESDFFKENINVIYTNKFDENEIAALFSSNISDMYYNRSIICEYTPYVDFKIEYQNSIYRSLKFFKANVYIDVNTVHTRKYWVIENFIKNLRYFKDGKLINSFKNKFEGATAIIVSAGPSLDKNIKDLIGYENDVIIFSGGRPLRALLNAGIKPHFNFSVDMMPKNYELYEKYDILNVDIPLITSVENQYLINKHYKGKKIFSELGVLSEEYVKDWYETDIDRLFVSGSVATLQMSAAVYMGCKKIIFMGQDLAFTEDKVHSSLASDGGSNVIHQKKVYGEIFYLYVKGNYQDKILTRYDFNQFRLSIQDYIRQDYSKDCQFINATEGGAYIEGTKISTLKEALKSVDKNKFDTKKIIDEVMELSDERQKNIDVEKKLSEFLDDLKNILKLSKKGMDVSAKMKAIENYSGNNKYLLQLDKIDAKIEKYDFAYDFVKRFTKTLSVSVLGKKDDSIEHLLDNVRQVYKDINEIADMCIKILEEELKELKEISDIKS